eukprot:1558441-Rhodomonas_salina.1
MTSRVCFCFQVTFVVKTRTASGQETTIFTFLGITTTATATTTATTTSIASAASSGANIVTRNTVAYEYYSNYYYYITSSPWFSRAVSQAGDRSESEAQSGDVGQSVVCPG